MLTEFLAENSRCDAVHLINSGMKSWMHANFPACGFGSAVVALACDRRVRAVHEGATDLRVN